jgi:4-hydroxybenzoate polyprenyltransferase
MVILIQFLFWFFVISAPYGEVNLVYTFFGWKELLWMCLASLFIAASGNAINDFFDFENDRFNHKQKALSKRQFRNMYIIFSILGLSFSILSAWSFESYILGFIYFGIWGLLYFYSKDYQQKMWIGNIVVAFLTAMLIGIMWTATYLYLQPLVLRPQIIINKYLYISKFAGIYMLFAFLLSWIREIVKDVEDSKGDQQSGFETLIIRWGMKKTFLVLQIISAFFVLLLVFTIQKFLTDKAYILAVSFVFILSVFAYFHYLLSKVRELKDWHRLSIILKIIMLIGVLTLIFIPSGV